MAAVGRKAAAGFSPFLWFLSHPLCPEPPFCLDTETGGNEGFGHKRRNAKECVFFLNDKSTKPGFLEEEKYAFLPQHKKKPWLLVSAQQMSEKHSRLPQ